MHQVFIANPKGGCGKTTISTQLAGYFAKNNLRVILMDHDAQKSSSDWVRGRAKTAPKIKVITSKEVESLPDTGTADIVIHDMPAAWSLQDVASIIKSGDKVLIPILSSPNDIKACIRFIMGLNRSGVMDKDIKIGLVGNRIKSRTKYATVLKDFIEQLELPLISTLRDTQNYVRAMDEGKTIFDLPASQAERDLEDWYPILYWLGFPK